MGRAFAALAGLLLLLAGCGGGAREYTSEAGNYKIRMPGAAEEKQQTVNTPAGPMALNVAMATNSDGTTSGVTYSDLPEAAVRSQSPKAVLDGGVRGLAGAGQTIVDSKPIDYKGHPGRDLRTTARPSGAPEEMTGRVRVYLVGNRLYQIMILGPKSKLSDESAKEFVDSFALLHDQPVTASAPTETASAPDSPPAEMTSAPPPQKSVTSAFTRPPKRGKRSNSPPTVTAAPPSAPATPPPANEAATASAGGASIVDFRWVDADEDLLGGHGGHDKPDNTKDQHFKLALELPPDTVIEEITITSGGFHKWVTKPTPSLWSVGVLQDGKEITKKQVERVGTFSGQQTFDLYVNTGIGIGPGTQFEVAVVVNIGGEKHTLSSQCKRT